MDMKLERIARNENDICSPCWTDAGRETLAVVKAIQEREYCIAITNLCGNHAEILRGDDLEELVWPSRVNLKEEGE